MRCIAILFCWWAVGWSFSGVAVTLSSQPQMKKYRCLWCMSSTRPQYVVICLRSGPRGFKAWEMACGKCKRPSPAWVFGRPIASATVSRTRIWAGSRLRSARAQTQGYPQVRPETRRECGAKVGCFVYVEDIHRRDSQIGPTNQIGNQPIPRCENPAAQPLLQRKARLAVQPLLGPCAPRPVDLSAVPGARALRKPLKGPQEPMAWFPIAFAVRPIVPSHSKRAGAKCLNKAVHLMRCQALYREDFL